MARITVKSWRDIPSMVVVGRGRGAAKASLPERFEQAIDMAAMRVGAKDEDAYLAEWRNVDHGEADVAEDPQEVAERVAAELDAALGKDALKELIENEGWAKPPSGDA